jgi:hypothetical protein
LDGIIGAKLVILLRPVDRRLKQLELNELLEVRKRWLEGHYHMKTRILQDSMNMP